MRSRLILKNQLRFKIHRKISTANKFCKLNDVPIIDLNRLLAHKTSDTIHVLASGSSINDISDNQWKIINAADSVGLNNWLLHEFVPTFYFFESDADLDRHKDLNKIRFDNFFARKDQYMGIPTIVHFSNKRYFDIAGLKEHNLASQCHFQASFALPAESTEDFIQSLNLANELGLYEKINPAIYRRGSIARIIHFAVCMGYKNIVLHGTDLNGSEFFFDSYDDKQIPKGCIRPNLQDYLYTSKDGLKKQDKIHMTADPRVHPVTMLEIIDLINTEILLQKGITIEVANKESALAAVIPVSK